MNIEFSSQGHMRILLLDISRKKDYLQPQIQDTILSPRH